VTIYLIPEKRRFRIRAKTFDLYDLALTDYHTVWLLWALVRNAMAACRRVVDTELFNEEELLKMLEEVPA
jgi:hypothetical protein